MYLPRALQALIAMASKALTGAVAFVETMGDQR